MEGFLGDVLVRQQHGTTLNWTSSLRNSGHRLQKDCWFPGTCESCAPDFASFELRPLFVLVLEEYTIVGWIRSFINPVCTGSPWWYTWHVMPCVFFVFYRKDCLCSQRCREENRVKERGKKINFPFHITENFDQINAFYFQYKFYVEWKNENDSIKYFLKIYLGYKQRK